MCEIICATVYRKDKVNSLQIIKKVVPIIALMHEAIRKEDTLNFPIVSGQTINTFKRDLFRMWDEGSLDSFLNEKARDLNEENYDLSKLLDYVTSPLDDDVKKYLAFDVYTSYNLLSREAETTILQKLHT